MEGAKAVNCRWNGMQAFSGDPLDYQGPHLVAGLTQTRFPSANLIRYASYTEGSSFAAAAAR